MLKAFLMPKKSRRLKYVTLAVQRPSLATIMCLINHFIRMWLSTYLEEVSHTSLQGTTALLNFSTATHTMASRSIFGLQAVFLLSCFPEVTTSLYFLTRIYKVSLLHPCSRTCNNLWRKKRKSHKLETKQLLHNMLKWLLWRHLPQVASLYSRERAISIS